MTNLICTLAVVTGCFSKGVPLVGNKPVEVKLVKELTDYYKIELTELNCDSGKEDIKNVIIVPKASCVKQDD